MRQIILVLFLWGLNFFAFRPRNIRIIREALFHLIHWGFDYDSLIHMPVYEFQDYLKFLCDYNKKNSGAELDEESEIPTRKTKDGKTIGQTMPGIFNGN